MSIFCAIFHSSDENEHENSETKQSESNSQDTNSDDDRKRRNSADDTNSLEIKRERNENNTKIDGNDGEINTASNGKSNVHLCFSKMYDYISEL